MLKDSPSLVGADFQDSFFFQQAKSSQLEVFESEKGNFKTEVAIPLDANSSAILAQKNSFNQEMVASTEEETTPTSSSMQWRLNVGVCGGQYYYEVRIVETPSIVMLGWAPAKARIFQDTVFSFGCDENSFMLDCSAGVQWNDGCMQPKVCAAAQVDDIYGTALDYDNKKITFYHVRKGIRTDLDQATFDSTNFRALLKVRQALFPSIGVYNGQVAILANPTSELAGYKPIADGMTENKLEIYRFHSTNLPATTTFEYHLAYIEWMSKIYVKYFDGHQLPYGPEAYRHMTAPFFSIFHPQLFGDEVPEVEQFNQHPTMLANIFHRAFLHEVVWDGFLAYLRFRHELYIKSLPPVEGERPAFLEVRPRTDEEIDFESALASSLLFLHARHFEDCTSNGLYRENHKMLPSLIKKVAPTLFAGLAVDSSMLRNDEYLEGIVEEVALMKLWGQITLFVDRAKNETRATKEVGLEKKLADTLQPLLEKPPNVALASHSVWKAFVQLCLPGLELPSQSKAFKEYVIAAKRSLTLHTPTDVRGELNTSGGVTQPSPVAEIPPQREQKSTARNRPPRQPAQTPPQEPQQPQTTQPNAATVQPSTPQSPVQAQQANRPRQNATQASVAAEMTGEMNVKEGGLEVYQTVGLIVGALAVVGGFFYFYEKKKNE